MAAITAPAAAITQTSKASRRQRRRTWGSSLIAIGNAR
jgi:hypothetical protein